MRVQKGYSISLTVVEILRFAQNDNRGKILGSTDMNPSPLAGEGGQSPGEGTITTEAPMPDSGLPSPLKLHLPAARFAV